MYILKKLAKFQKKNICGKVIGLQYQNLQKWNMVLNVFLEIEEIIFYSVFQSSCYRESLQINDKFCSSSLVIFLSMVWMNVFLKINEIMFCSFFQDSYYV